MLPNIAIKFLRDGMDSANAFGAYDVELGVDNYNFLAYTLSNARSPKMDAKPGFKIDFAAVAAAVKPASDFVTQLGSSNFASYD